MKGSQPLMVKAKSTLTRVLSKVTGKSNAPLTCDSCPSNMYNRLCSAPRDVPKFDLDGQNIWVRLLGVHDGDSCSVALLFADKIYKTNLRLLGLDTPEIRTKDSEEKTKAIKARNRLLFWAAPDHFPMDNQFTDKQIKDILWQHPCIIFIRCEEEDKFGRNLSRLFKSEADRESINDILIKEGHADEYFGGTKVRSWA